jgi:hypothetical protein
MKETVTDSSADEGEASHTTSLCILFLLWVLASSSDWVQLCGALFPWLETAEADINFKTGKTFARIILTVYFTKKLDNLAGDLACVSRSKPITVRYTLLSVS